MAEESQDRARARFNPYRVFEGIMVPLGLLADRTLTAGAKLLYGRLLRYAGKNGRCYPAVGTLACDLGVRERQIRYYLIELEHHFLIRRHSIPGRANDIEFPDAAPWPPPLQDTAPLQGIAPLPLQEVAGGACKELQGGAAIGCSQSEVLKRSTEAKHSEAKKNTDHDCPATRRKDGDGQPGVNVASLPESLPKQYPRLRGMLARYLSGSETPDPKDYPTHRRAVEVLDAAGAGVTEDQVVKCLDHLYNERGLRPGTKHGPRNSRWFLTVVREHFDNKRRQEEAAQPCGHYEWADRNDAKQAAMLEALELPDAEGKA